MALVIDEIGNNNRDEGVVRKPQSSAQFGLVPRLHKTAGRNAIVNQAHLLRLAALKFDELADDAVRVPQQPRHAFVQLGFQLP